MTWRLAAAALGIVAAAALVPALRHLRERPPAPDPPLALALQPPPGAEFGSSADLTLDLAIAPSGREVVFAASANGEARLWRRPLASDEATPIPDTTGAAFPAYSPDGTTIWYFAEGRLRAVAVAGGAPRDVAEAPEAGGVSVRADGVVLASLRPGPISRVSAEGVEAVTALRPGERSHTFPAWTGRGDEFVYLATLDDGRRRLWLRDGEGERDLGRADSHALAAAGVLVFVRDGALRAEPLEPRPRERVPRADTLAVNVGVSASGRGAFAVTDRLLVYGRQARRLGVLRWVAADGTMLAPVAEPGDYWQVRLSPDGRTAAVTARDPLLRTLDIFTVPADGGDPSRVTLAVAADTDPVWSPDGRRLAHRSWQDGQPNLFATPVAAPGRDTAIWRSPLDEVPTDWTETEVIYHARSPETGFDLWRVGADPGGEATPLVRSTFNEVDGRVSPDGRWLAYASDESGQSEVYVERFGTRGPRVRVSSAGGTKPQWTAGGRAIAFRRGDEVLRADFSEAGGAPRTTVPSRLLTLPGLRDCALSRDGTRLLAIVPADRPAAAAAQVLVNWRVP